MLIVPQDTNENCYEVKLNNFGHSSTETISFFANFLKNKNFRLCVADGVTLSLFPGKKFLRRQGQEGQKKTNKTKIGKMLEFKERRLKVLYLSQS